jgi:uncharacterized protein YndB with AHSA1/START domain
MCNQTLRKVEPMEYGSIEREIHVEASPEVVYDVVSSPEHLREWWPDDANFASVPGATGELIWADKSTGRTDVVPITVVDTQPPRLFSFRWVHPQGEAATANNSFLVTFELIPTGSGTTVRLTETGFREQGWEVAVLEERYAEHASGWDIFVPRLGEYVARLVAAR